MSTFSVIVGLLDVLVERRSDLLSLESEAGVLVVKLSEFSQFGFVIRLRDFLNLSVECSAEVRDEGVLKLLVELSFISTKSGRGFTGLREADVLLCGHVFFD